MNDAPKWQPKVIKGEGQKSSAERAREVAQAVLDYHFGALAITVETPKPDLRVVPADAGENYTVTRGELVEPRKGFAWAEAWETLAPKP